MEEAIYLKMKRAMNNGMNLSERDWGVFRISDLFSLTTGANIDKSLLRKGTTPRITAKDTCNGIDSYTSELNINTYRTNKNCISVSFLGSVYYQPYRASYDMKIHSLVPKGITLNRYIGFFLATVLRIQFSKFSYGNQLSSTDLPKQNIMLPVCPDGTPDWAYMVQKSKYIEKKILLTYFNCKMPAPKSSEDTT